jgi:hypothetical protein
LWDTMRDTRSLQEDMRMAGEGKVNVEIVYCVH